MKFSGIFGQASKASAIQSQSESVLLFTQLFHPPPFQLFILLAIKSQLSPNQLLFISNWELLLLIGQLSRLQTFLCNKNISLFILSAVIEQSLFSYFINQIKFFVQSQSISSSQISGIQSLSISQEYCERDQFIIAHKQTSVSAIAIVDIVSKSKHSFI